MGSLAHQCSCAACAPPCTWPAACSCAFAHSSSLITAAGSEYDAAVTLTKQNYFSLFPLKERCWDGVFTSSFIHFSSGSTGTPTMWPRTLQSELEVALTFERVMKDAFEAQSQLTLCVIAFPLGVHHLSLAPFLLVRVGWCCMNARVSYVLRC
jgi:hypothetical protein